MKFTIEQVPFVSTTREKLLRVVEDTLQVRFNNIALLNLALCHKSYLNETNEKCSNYEKLELLGDSVLGLSVVEFLYKNFPDKNEGDLAKIKSHVVSTAVLSEIGSELGIDNYILIGRGEELSGGRSRGSLIEDCMEAIFGAYYLDAGNFEAARTLVMRLLEPKIDDYVAGRSLKDYKSELQKFVQRKYKKNPEYIEAGVDGPDHNRVYHMKVKVNRKIYGPQSGPNKKEAEQRVAEEAYKCLVDSQ